MISQLEEGSFDNLLSASRGNEIIRAVNRLDNIRGGTGIKVTKSETNILIEATNTLTANGLQALEDILADFLDAQEEGREFAAREITVCVREGTTKRERKMKVIGTALYD